MSFGGDADEAMSARLYARCIDAGINAFDCADFYSQGVAEEILGRLMAPHRESLVIATKAYFPVGDGPNDGGSSAYHLVRAVEASLQRLATDRIDLFYLHRFDDNTPLEETLRAVERLVSDGKILYPAVSNFAAWQVARAIGIQEARAWSPVACIQPMYNLVKRQAEVELLPMAAAEGVAVLPYSPLGAGLLTGRYGIDRRPESGRLTESQWYRIRYGEPGYYRIADEFTALAAELGHAPTALAIAWVASHPAVTAPILGARNVEQLDACLAAADIDITPEVRERISALSPTPAPATDRNEEQAARD